ncbi:U6 snRNA phosphodiesterase 1-like [Ylistrum balloti]|uniref:U6 snRNA phosphodiesterase 1-like n=1 Tax=Ylistrum balloti TaxID=509963 RepID=UPI002905F177|nr:U6 snRNA phosphodiesterase 1-like [Ylistrum balloti]
MSCLVSYSDSDEERTDGTSDTHTSDSRVGNRLKRCSSPEVNLETKKVKHSANVLPLPDTIKSLFAEKSRTHQDDPEKHDGRIRSFAHEEGSWATHVHIPYDHDSRFNDLVSELLLCLRPLDFKPMESFHISLSRTVSLRHHWIKSLTDSLQAKARILHKCYCEMISVKLYTNDEKNRTFVAVEVHSHPAVLRDYVVAVDKCLEEFGLQKYYKDPSFHMSVGWCLGDVLPDVTDEKKRQLQVVLDGYLHTNPDLKLLPVDQIQCRSGNKVFTFTLDT